MIGTFVKGQRVRVYPHGSEDQASLGDVLIISDAQRLIAVRFDHFPKFVSTAAMPLIGVGHDGVIMIAGRYEIGPWIEMAGGGHYEIEAGA